MVSKPSRRLRRFLGPLLARLAEAAAPLEMTHQVDRDDFESVEAHGRQMFGFHSKGEGYGHVSFVAYSMTPFDVWKQLMHQWAAGTLSAAPIPTAKLVDR